MMNKLKIISLPIFVAIYPILFLYSINVEELSLNMVWVPIIVSILFALFITGAALLIQRQLIKAANSAAIMMLFFYLYGAVYDGLLSANAFPVRQRYVLPLIIAIAIFAAWLISRSNTQAASRVNAAAWIIVLLLIGYNLAVAVPKEFGKTAVQPANKAVVSSQQVSTAVDLPNKRPDIYFIILDEFAGPKAMREYWNDHQVDQFIAFLRSKGFFVAEASRSTNRNTLIEIASRLNLKDYSKQGDTTALFNLIADNKVMRILKSYGYTTVYFDGTKEAYPTKPDILADYNLTYSSENSDTLWGSVNDFSLMVLDTSIFRPLSKYLKDRSPHVTNHRKAVLYSFHRTANLSDIPSPKFVYSHILIPHVPFVFDENGNALNLENPLDWNYYLGQYKFAMKESQKLVTQLLENADPNNPPVIILQSDHGARNKKEANSIVLDNYSNSYTHDILNAIYLPGYDTSRLPDDLSPYEPFEIILNYYLNAGVKFEH